MDLDMRPVEEAEFAAYHTAVSRGFGSDPDTDPGLLRAVLPLDRTLATFADGTLVGTLGDLPFELTVPGGSAVPMAGTTVVTVRPTHRRRGILARMMRRHLDQAVERGDPLAGLWASEAPIYGRFGYGSAADRHRIRLDTGDVELPAGPADIETRLIEPDRAAELLPGLHDELRPTRAGMLSRTPAWWRRRHQDHDRPAGGGAPRRHVLAVRDQRPVGYAVYRQKPVWDDWVAKGEVDVLEVVAGDADARRALWRLLTSIDLFPRVGYWNAPVDDPMIHEVANPRSITRTVGDGLWLRILDPVAALQARHYQTDGRIVLEMTDGFLEANTGRYRITVDGGTATVGPTTAPADIHLDAGVLAALYLGGRSATQLASAGHLTGAPDAVDHLDRLFRTTVAPWCPEVF